MGKLRLSLIVLSFLVVACQSKPPIQEFDLTPLQSVSEDSYEFSEISEEDETSPQKIAILNEISSLDGQIAGLKGSIAGAQARISHFQVSGLIGSEGMVASAQAELSSYQSQKLALESRKQMLMSQLSVIQ